MAMPKQCAGTILAASSFVQMIVEKLFWIKADTIELCV